jgi:phage antirepressor YoqD-like protein
MLLKQKEIIKEKEMGELVKVNDFDIEVTQYQDTWAVSNRQVAEAFGVSEQAIRSQKNRNEFIYGIHFYMLQNATGNADMTMWTKKGVITLGFKLRKTPATIAFRDWASDYILKPKNVQHSIPQTYSDALLLAANQAKEIEEQKKTLELQAPRIAFADKLQKAEGTLSIRDFAKVLCDKCLPLGEKRLFENLRTLGILDRTNKPYQHYVDMGVLTLKEGLYTNQTTGDAIAYTQVRVTTKGQEYLYRLLTLGEKRLVMQRGIK